MQEYYFDLKGNPVQKIAVGNTVRIRIKTNNMVGENIQYIVWEYDLFGDADKIIFSTAFKVPADSLDTQTLTITPERFKLGIDNKILYDPDDKEQQYFIEVIPLGSKANSKKFGLDDEAKRMKVENGKSPAKVEPSPKPKDDKNKCFCDRVFVEKEVRQLVKLLKGTETVWEGQAIRGGGRVPCNISDKSFATLTNSLNNAFKKYNINNCAQKMHFLAQVCEETGIFASSEETKGVFISSQSIYKGRGLLQLTGIRVDPNDKKSRFDNPGPYKDYANYKNDPNIIKTPEIVANNVDYGNSVINFWTHNLVITLNLCYEFTSEKMESKREGRCFAFYERARSFQSFERI